VKVEDAMSKQVATVLAGEAVRDAALLMDREDRGSLFVLAEDGSGRVEGVLTDRDIGLAVATHERGIGELQVRALMSADAHVCHPSDDLRRALEIIESCGRRRLPVVDEAGHILGAITLTDITRVVTRSGEAGVSASDVCRALVACSSRRRDPEHRLLG
jgi:CBS domain-containing protein